ncbi:MAG: MFS transporter [Prevotellaceae bacterium]|jgi:nitrate/nitrite transporter NarK|nr:MFS transporter [Prevotellaceae bacterium]
MASTLQKSLRDSKGARWTALIIVSFMMLCGYYFNDVMAPLKGLLENQLSWSSSEFGIFTGAYGWFNVFLLMLIIGGIILDKMGVRFTGTMAAIFMVVGACFKYWAVTTHLLDGYTLFNIKLQVLGAGLGFAIFGVGVEVAGITVSKTIVKWFKGKELALAMGMEMAMARIGTGIAMFAPLPLANYLKLSTPILLGIVLLCVGMIAFFIYTFQDRKLDKEIAAEAVGEEESFKIKDIVSIFTNRAWWFIAILCVLFYSAVFPFLKYATDLMIQKFHVNPDFAGSIPALLPFGTILLTPFFGNLYDRRGKGASIMVTGSIMLICIHGLFSVPFLEFRWVAVALILTLGVAFSLVPSAMWPSVPKIVPEKQLGTAYSMIFWVQNWGLMGVPMLIGKVLDKFCVVNRVLADGSVQKYDYTLPMLIFTCFGVLALLFAFLLKREDARKGYGLEQPNIKK